MAALCLRSKREDPLWVNARRLSRSLWSVAGRPCYARDSLRCVIGIVSLSCLLLVVSCSPGYVLRAAYEEGRILWRRKPIMEELARDDLDPALRAKFETVLGVREFARTELGLRVGGSYASVSFVDRPVLSYLLTAVPKTKFEPHTWWFLFVGSVPYKGYFDRGDAEEAARDLEGRGYDTNIRAVGAFSTLGWFDDPLLEHLLRLDRVRLVEVILHELLHNTLFVPGSVDFNESMANFVGKRGAIAYFTERSGSSSAAARTARHNWEDEREFSRFLMYWVECLRALYREDISEREKLRRRSALFAEMQKAWRAEIVDRPDHLHAAFATSELNNAVLMQYYLYVNHLDWFEQVYEHAGGNLGQAVEQIRAATESGKEAPFDALAKLAGVMATQARGPVCTGSRGQS